MFSLAPLTGSWSAQGPLPPLKHTASSLTVMRQPFTSTLVQASRSTPSALAERIGATGEKSRRPITLTWSDL